MSTTNSLTADAATQTAVSPIRPLLLIGLFRNATSDYVLVQPLGGDIVRLSVSVPTAGLRLIPNMDVWRPGSSTETAVAWVAAVERKNGPSSLVLSRQGVPGVKHDAKDFDLVRKGGYVFSDVAGAEVIIIANGSELALAVGAAAELNAAGTKTRVVSMPSTNVFDRQDQAYRDSVLTPGVKRVAVEAAHPDFWRKYVGLEGAVVGIDTFGESAPGGEVMKHFGFTVENVVKTVKSIL